MSVALLRLLPLELLGCIVQYSDTRDQTVLACVSRDFNVETNRVLYASVQISTERAAHNFTRTLATRPDLAALVCALDISLQMFRDFQSIDLANLVHLRHLNINTLSHPSQFLSRLRDDQLRSLELSYAWLGSSGDLTRFLARQRQLTRLSLDESCKPGWNDLPLLQALECTPHFAIALGPGRPIRDLTILGAVEEPFLNNILDALPRSVRSLDISLDETHAHHLVAIARALPDLEAVKLNNVILKDFDTLATSDDLPYFPKLRVLHLQLDLDKDFEFDTVLPTCRRLYDNLKKTSSLLEQLDVSFEDFHCVGTYTIESSDHNACTEGPTAF